MARDPVLRVDAAPGPGRTTPVRERLEMLGGKGANQAVGMAQLGLEPVLVGVVGDDPTGGTLIDDARRSGIDVRHVVRRQGARTALIASVVNGEGWHYCEDVPDAVLVGPDDLGPVAETVATVGTIVLQLQQPQATVRSAAELARRSGGRVVLDGAPSAGDRYALLELTDVVRADAREAVGLADLTGVPVGGRDEIAGGDDAVRVAQTLLELGPSFAAVAAGPDGNAFAWPGGEVVVPLAGGPVVDSTGAGDAMVAALVAAFAGGEEPSVAAAWAAAAAGLTVKHLGGRPALTRELVSATAGAIKRW